MATRITHNRHKTPTYCEGGEEVTGVLLLRFTTRDDARRAESVFDKRKLYVGVPLVEGTAKSVH